MIVLTFTITIYYNFLAILYNPYVSAMEDRFQAMIVASGMCSFVLFFVLIFFMLHTSNFFYKQRYKEIATYMLMGIRKKQIARVIAIESIIVGGIVLILGSLLGLIFSKLFFMLLGSTSIMNTHIPFYFSFKAIRTLVILFAGILLVIAFRNSYLVKHSKLIHLLNASKKEESMPKQRVIRGILGVIGIGIGYYKALSLRNQSDKLLGAWPIILILVCVGTYFLYSGFFSMILGKAIENKHVSYRGSRLISLSNTLFRLGTNYRSYAATTILCASTLTALMTSLTLRQFEVANAKLETPYSISYLNQDETINKKVKEKIKASGAEIIGQSQVHFIKATVANQIYGESSDIEVIIAPYSELKENVEMLNSREVQKTFKAMEPSHKTVSKIVHAKVLVSIDRLEEHTYQIGGENYSLQASEKIPFLGSMPNIGNLDTLVVTDEAYDNIKTSLNAQEQCINNVNIKHQEQYMDLVSDLMRMIPDYANHMSCYAVEYARKYYVMGAVYFLGLILSIIFMITVFSTIYFKCMGDAYSDQKQYNILVKIGMSKEKINRSIRAQLSVAVILPTSLGIVHSWVAISILESFIHVTFWKPKFLGTGILLMGMLIFAIFISKKYELMVTKGGERL